MCHEMEGGDPANGWIVEQIELLQDRRNEKCEEHEARMLNPVEPDRFWTLFVRGRYAQNLAEKLPPKRRKVKAEAERWKWIRGGLVMDNDNWTMIVEDGWLLFVNDGRSMMVGFGVKIRVLSWLMMAKDE